MNDPDVLRETLLNERIIETPHATLTPLTGGISSEIYLVEDGEQSLVVKQALERLRVEQTWFADTSRNHYEQSFLRYVARFRPDAVPRLIYSNCNAEFFCMEYLEGFTNWKRDLLEGKCDVSLSEAAGQLLGEIHTYSWGDKTAEREFSTLDNFEQLRIDPYLRATAAKHSTLTNRILVEADRLRQMRRCLVHGDFSPKNLLHRDGRLVLVDCEVAWFGDPAFDLAFFLNHLLLKSLYHAPQSSAFESLIWVAWESYRNANPHAPEIESHVTHLLPMLMLARVDGKSPVEYLSDEAKLHYVREFATAEILKERSCDMDALLCTWFNQLNRLKQ